MTRALSVVPEMVDDVDELVRIDRQIDIAEQNAAADLERHLANKRESLRQRWEFGRVMLAARGGMARLPNGYLAELVERTGKSRTEFTYRMQFAERYPDEEELLNALSSFASWFQITQNLAVPKPEPVADPMSEVIDEPESASDPVSPSASELDEQAMQEAELINALNEIFRREVVAKYSPKAKRLMIKALKAAIARLEQS